MKIVITEGVPPENWEEVFEKGGKRVGISQSVHRARVLQHAENAHPYYLRIFEAARLIAQLLVIKRDQRIRGWFKQVVWKLLRQGESYFEWQDSLLFLTDEQDEKLQAMHLLIKWMESSAGQMNFFQSFGIFAATSDLNNDEEILALLRSNGYSIIPWATYLVDLNLPEEDIWKNLKRSARKAINKAKKAGAIVVSIRTVEDLETAFYGSYRAFEEAAGRHVNPFERFKVVWEEDDKSYYRFYVVKDEDGIILATLGMYMVNGVATEIASSMSGYAFERKIPAQDLLHWQMFLDAKSEGCDVFNLAGVNPEPNLEKERGIRQFKEKWGGDYVEYFQFQRFYGLYGLLRKKLS